MFSLFEVALLIPAHWIILNEISKSRWGGGTIYVGFTLIMLGKTKIYLRAAENLIRYETLKYIIQHIITE